MMNVPSIILIGGGGHASVLIEILKCFNKNILGFVASENKEIKNYPELPYLGREDMILKNIPPNKVKLVNAVGAVSVESNYNRQRIFEQFKATGYHFETVIHPSAIIASTVQIEEGSQVMAGSILQSNAIVGKNTIINTATIIEHDCIIGDHVHVAPSVTICSHVKIGNYSHVGVKATVIQGIAIGDNVMINAGLVVTKDVTALKKEKCE